MLFLGPFSSTGSEQWSPNGALCTMTVLCKTSMGQDEMKTPGKILWEYGHW